MYTYYVGPCGMTGWQSREQHSCLEAGKSVKKRSTLSRPFITVPFHTTFDSSWYRCCFAPAIRMQQIQY